jgi:hypothetical protein
LALSRLVRWIRFSMGNSDRFAPLRFAAPSFAFSRSAPRKSRPLKSASLRSQYLQALVVRNVSRLALSKASPAFTPARVKATVTPTQKYALILTRNAYPVLFSIAVTGPTILSTSRLEHRAVIAPTIGISNPGLCVPKTRTGHRRYGLVRVLTIGFGLLYALVAGQFSRKEVYAKMLYSEFL